MVDEHRSNDTAGPEELTCGPYKDIRLELFDYRVDDLHAVAKLSDDLSTASITVDIVIEGDTTDTLSLELVLDAPEEVAGGFQHVYSTSLKVEGNKLSHSFTVQKPALWWPAGHGDPVLYDIGARLISKVDYFPLKSIYYSLISIRTQSFMKLRTNLGFARSNWCSAR